MDLVHLVHDLHRDGVGRCDRKSSGPGGAASRPTAANLSGAPITSARQAVPTTRFNPVPKGWGFGGAVWRAGGLCGRYASARPRHDLPEAFRVDEAHGDEEKAPDYNAGPTKTSPTVLARRPGDADDDVEPVWQLRNLKWGF